MSASDRPSQLHSADEVLENVGRLKEMVSGEGAREEKSEGQRASDQQQDGDGTASASTSIEVAKAVAWDVSEGGKEPIYEAPSIIPFSISAPLTPIDRAPSTYSTAFAHQPSLSSATSNSPHSLPLASVPITSMRDRISLPPKQIYAPSAFDLATFSAQLDKLSSFQLSPLPPSTPTTPMGPPFSSLLLPHFAEDEVSPSLSPAKSISELDQDEQAEKGNSPRPNQDRDSLLSMATTTSGLFTFPNSPVRSSKMKGKDSFDFGNDSDLIDFGEVSATSLRSSLSQADLQHSLPSTSPLPSLPASDSEILTPHTFKPPLPPSLPTPPSLHSKLSSPLNAPSESDISYTLSDEEDQEEDEDEGEGEEEDEQEEEEDPDTHPLYALLSSSTHPALRAFWDASTLILVPPRRSLPSLAPLLPPVVPSEATSAMPSTPGHGFEFVRGGKGVGGELVGREGLKERGSASDTEREKEELVRYVGLHAFRPEIERASGDAWRSVGRAKMSQNDEPSKEAWLRVDLELSRGLIHVEWAGANSPTAPPEPTPRSTMHLDRSTSKNSSSEEGFLPELVHSTRTEVLAAGADDDFRRGSLDSDASSTMPPTPPALTALSFPPSDPSLTLKSVGLPQNPVPFPSQLPAATSSSEQASPLSSATRSLQMVSETTIYRRTKQLGPVIIAAPAVSPKPVSKPAFRTPKWLRRGGTGSPSSSSNSTTSLKKTAFESTGPVLERVRVVAVDGQVVEGWPAIAGPANNPKRRLRGTPSEDRRRPSLEPRQTSSFGGLGRASREPSLVDLGVPAVMHRRRVGRTDSIASTRSARSAGSGWQQAGGTLIASKRDFLQDLCFLMTPPQQLSVFTPILQKSVTNIHSLALDFERSFDYIKGFDVYTVQRIRKRIFEQVFSELVSDLRDMDGGPSFMADERGNLPLLVENVILGFLHSKLYTHSILPNFTDENTNINDVLVLYRTRNVTLDDFGISIDGLGVDDLQGAVALLSQLTSPSDSIPMAELGIMLDVSPEIVQSLLVAKTPLSSLSTMRLAIEEIVAAVGRVNSPSRAAPDDLIPLLAWVIVHSEAENLESILFYVKKFRLSESMAPEFEWSLVTFHASIAFLVSDPLQAVVETPVPASTSATSFPFYPSSPQRYASDLPSFRARRASVHVTQQSNNMSSPRSLFSTGLPRIQTQGIGYGRGVSSAVSPVLERRHSKSSFHHNSSDARPNLSSSLSGTTSRAGPPFTSFDMRRSESEGSPTVSRLSGDLWSRWATGTESEQAPESIEGEASESNQSWWAWGKERFEGTSGVPSTSVMSQLERVRSRRHSASGDVLQRPDSSALSARFLATSQSRPPSVVSLRSLVSLEAENSSISSPPPSKRSFARRSTQSLMRRDLAASDLFASPSAPRLDSSSVLSLPASASISKKPLILGRYATIDSLPHSSSISA